MLITCLFQKDLHLPAGLIYMPIFILLSGSVYFLVCKKNKRLLQSKEKELSSKDVAVEHLRKENEWLLKELHHRVKNNLQIVTSLLHSQSAYLKDHAAIDAIMGSQHRIQAMSLIHKRLYQPGSLATVAMPDYIAELVNYLRYSFNSNVHCELQIEDIKLQIVHAVPIGLILNEILTNAIKFAFPYSAQDCISLKFFRLSSGGFCLEVKDNGRGLPEGFSINNKTSFGMLLIKGLTDQLDGDFSIENNGGTSISICFFE